MATQTKRKKKEGSDLKPVVQPEINVSEDYLKINRFLIQRNPNNPRTIFDDLEGLAESIKRKGIIEPLIVYKIREVDEDIFQKFWNLHTNHVDLNKEVARLQEIANRTSDEKDVKRYAATLDKSVSARVKANEFFDKNKDKIIGYELIAGERRWRASELAGLDIVPVICRTGETADDRSEIAIIENLQRKDIEPMDEARGYQKLLETTRYTEGDIARAVGRSARFIAERIELNKLIPELVKLLETKVLPVGHGLAIAGLSPEGQKKVLQDGLYSQSWLSSSNKLRVIDTYERVVAYINREILHNLITAPFSKTDKNLHPKGQTCDTCPHNSNSKPTLYAEIGKKDNCLNPVCFRNKLDSHITNLRAAIAEEEKRPLSEVPFIADSYLHKYQGEPVLQTYEYRVVDQKEICASAQKGILINGKDIGLAKLICQDRRRCPIHWQKAGVGNSTSAPPTSEQKKQAREREREYQQDQFENRLRTLTRRAVYQRTVARPDFESTVDASEAFQIRVLAVVYSEYEENSGDVGIEHIEKYLGISIEYDHTSLPTGWETSIAKLDRETRLKLLYLLIMDYGTDVDNTDSIVETKELAAQSNLDYRLLEAEKLLEIAPAEFKDQADDYLAAIKDGRVVEKPCFYFDKRYPDSLITETEKPEEQNS